LTWQPASHEEAELTTAFEHYLRTGRRVHGAITTEFKFNPWHDPEDGRFTFAGQGRYFAAGDRSSGGGSGATPQRRPKSSPHHFSRFRQYDPNNPRNYSIYVVKRGDSLTKIARLRRGLKANDLAWLNQLRSSDTLRVGQRIKVPQQRFLDAGRRARDNFLALAHYADITGGKLPPNAARAPSIADQVEAAGVREINRNGYAYAIDSLQRTRRVSGEIRLGETGRSRGTQINAGKPDRRATDDGGHFIAARFNGPREWFNHFAQDASFNRGAYRTLENQWAAATGSGMRVFVEIVPQYHGTSMRPYSLIITWYVGGLRRRDVFQNEKRGK
jgi:LysM repeat protein